MKIHSVPIEAYRRADNQATAPKESADGKKLILKDNQKADLIRLSGLTESTVSGMQAAQSPSLLHGVLSSEERAMLMQYFGRLGDVPESTDIYTTNARVAQSRLTGLKVDLRG